MDFVVQTESLPAPGQTVLGKAFQMIPGGKGANQACAAGRLAGNALVRMVGRVGYDIFADHLKASLAAAGVDVSGVAAVRNEPTGVALIGVDAAGQNSIIVASGANGAFLASGYRRLSRQFPQLPGTRSSSWRLRSIRSRRRCAWRGGKAPRRSSILLPPRHSLPIYWPRSTS